MHMRMPQGYMSICRSPCVSPEQPVSTSDEINKCHWHFERRRGQNNNSEVAAHMYWIEQGTKQVMERGGEREMF